MPDARLKWKTRLGKTVQSTDRAYSFRRIGVTLAVIAAIGLAIVPTGFSVSSGIVAGDGGFHPEADGCTACHGDHAFSGRDAAISVTFTDAEGNPLNGPYEHDAVYTITISLDDQNEPGADNKAGFNFFIDAGELASIDDTARIGDTGDATHTGAGFTTWNLQWTAPAEGAATWRLFVNDVDGSAAPDAGDDVYLRVGSVLDDHYAMPGAVEEHEPHVGVSLPQYWLGLIALGMMAIIIGFAYIYIKYSSPHNADHKDR